LVPVFKSKRLRYFGMIDIFSRYLYPKFDSLVKSQETSFFVIPAKAGIQ
jgi:hypothetical protein